VLVMFGNGRRYYAQVISRQAEPDLALLKIERPKVEPVRRILRSARQGVRAVVHGFPGNRNYLRRASFVRGYRHYVDNPDDLILSGTAEQGESGGPIFDADGNLLGLLWGSRPGETIAVTPEQINSFLDGAFQRPEPSPQTESVPLPGPAPESPAPVVAPPTDVQQTEPTPADTEAESAGFGDVLIDYEQRLAALEARPPEPIPDLSQFATAEDLQQAANAAETERGRLRDAIGKAADVAKAAAPTAAELLADPRLWALMGPAFGLGGAGVAVAIPWLLRRLRRSRREESADALIVAESVAEPDPRPTRPSLHIGHNYGCDDELAFRPPESTVHNRYVRVKETDVLGEAFKDALAREVETNPHYEAVLRRVENMAGQIAHGKRMSKRMGATRRAS